MMNDQQIVEIEREIKDLEDNQNTTVKQMRLFMQSTMPCGHAVGNLLTCPTPPSGCVICNGIEKKKLVKEG